MIHGLTERSAWPGRKTRLLTVYVIGATIVVKDTMFGVGLVGFLEERHDLVVVK